MERLTERYRDYIRIKGCSTLYSREERKGANTSNAIVRLAAIEDILGEDYDLDRLQELVKARDEGRMVELPCKIGDMVYVVNVDDQDIKEMEIKFFRSAPNGEICMQAECKDETDDCICNGPCGVIFSTENMHHRKIFLTRQEAEAALGGSK